MLMAAGVNGVLMGHAACRAEVDCNRELAIVITPDKKEPVTIVRDKASRKPLATSKFALKVSFQGCAIKQG